MNRIVLFILLMLTWLLLTWTVDLPGRDYMQDLGVGAVLAMIVTWTVGDRFAGAGAARWFDPRRCAWAVVFVFVLAASVVKANLEVAYRILHPRMPIRPGIVRVKSRLKSVSARTILGNAITLCPGTLTLDIWADGTILVHWIYVRTDDEQEAAREIIGRFEWYLERIFE